MHEVLLLGIAASELTILLTANPRRWSRRMSIFLTLLFAVICYSWAILGVSALANAIGASLAFVWFAWDLMDPTARGVLARWAAGALGFVALMSLNPASFPLLSLRNGRSIDLIVAVLFLVTGPVNYLITAILQCARGHDRDPVPGWVNAPVLPAMPTRAPGSADSVGEGDGAGGGEPAAVSGTLPVDSADSERLSAENNRGTSLRGGRWIGPLERLLIIVLAGANAEVAIAAAVAAKGVIRFPEISKDSSGEKAEEFIIGSVSSWILAALVSMFIRVAVGR